MGQDFILVRGARQHNLQNIDVDIPREQLVVITGLSGSGKSSLAFDTIYAEGQRRYVESLSAYARQFLGQMDKPDVDEIQGLSPAVSIDQKSAGRNPRSTVATVTEIYDYLRVLFARVGVPHCPDCGRIIARQTVDQMVDRLQELPEGTRFQILAPLVRGRKGEHRRLLEQVAKQGFARVRVDGEMVDAGTDLSLDKNRAHTVEVVVDRLVAREGLQQRLADSLEVALGLSGDVVAVHLVDEDQELVFSQELACAYCSLGLEEMSPRFFSFNTPYGACPHCQGLGVRREVDPELVVPNPELSLDEGAIAPWTRSHSYYPQLLQAVARAFGFSTGEPFGALDEEARKMVLYGVDQPVRVHYVNRFGETRVFDRPFEGVIPNLERRYRETESDGAREEIEAYMSARVCPECSGARLRREALAVTVGEKNIAQFTALPVKQAGEYLDGLDLSRRDQAIARRVLKEIRERLQFLTNVGLDYLTLDRPAATLSGGEAQRIRLATQIGSGLMGVLYVLDEPSIGLHQRDNLRLIDTLQRLRDLGNTVLVVEHDRDTILAADYVVDIGPGAGAAGGRVVATGTPREVQSYPDSRTGAYLSGREEIPLPAGRRSGNGKSLRVLGCQQHNLQDIDVAFPLGVFTCVTGVSGSGKSTLVHEILYRALAQRLQKMRREAPGAFRALEGWEHLEKVVSIDQAPIGRTPRSNPATYTGVFDFIRQLFADTPESRARGYKPGRFSFNVRGGRCEACRGDGVIRIEMHFLPDVHVPCEVCKGQRYNRETLEARFKGRSISEVLDMSVAQAQEFFANIPRIRRKLETMYDVGLGYMRLGQPATTLSGGEAQRVKLAAELSRRSNGKTLYLLDEPTTGLHFADIEQLLAVLQRLVDGGDTVVVIEHQLDVIKMADHVIDLGPEGGESGGRVVASGTPEEVAACPQSYTGYYLSSLLKAGVGHGV